MEQLSNELYAIAVLLIVGIAALIHLGWKILKVLERIAADAKNPISK